MTTESEWIKFLEEDHKILKEVWQRRGLNFDGDYLYIPIHHPNGDIAYTKKRKEPSYKGSEKYLNSAGTPITLYPFDVLAKADIIVLCEGELDALTLESLGIKAVYSTGGAGGFKKEFALYFKGKKVFVCYDNDERGKEGAERVAQILVSVGIEVKIVRLPEKEGIKDIGDFAKSGGSKNDFIELLRNAEKVRLLDQSSNTNGGIKANKNNSIPWPSPLAEAAYHGLAGEIIKTIEPHTEADPVALLLSFLTIFGSIVGNGPCYKVEADRHCMRLFLGLVGDTSKGRKGTSLGYVLNIFGGLDEDWKRNVQKGGLSSGEGLIWAVRDEIVKRQPIKERGRITGYEEVVEDLGIKDKRLLIIEAEFASTLRVLGREGNTLSAQIRNAWDQGDLQTLTKNSPARATNAHISIIAHTTKDELLRYLTATEAGNGFGNRFLLACVKRSKALPFGGNIQSVNFSSLVTRIKETIDFAKEVDEIKWSEEVKPLWVKIYPELSEGKPGLVGSMSARSEAYVCRLVCIYALLDKSHLIRVEHLKAAVAVWDYIESSLMFIFQDKLGDPLADRIIEALERSPEGISRTDISNYFGRNVESEQISLALNKLLEIGRVKSISVQTDGRTKELFSLNSLNSSDPLKVNYLERLEQYISENPDLLRHEKNEVNELDIGFSTDFVKEIKNEPFPY